jgi:hypothetical protein
MLRTFFALLGCAFAAAASTVQYNSLSAFTAALGAPITTIDFRQIGGGGNDVAMNGYFEAGTTFTGASNYLYGRESLDGFIYGPFGNKIHLALPAGSYGFGFDLGRFYGTMHDYEITLSNGSVFTLAAGDQFAGFISSTTLSQADVKILIGPAQSIYNLTSDYVIFYNVYVQETPEPAAMAMLGAGLLAFGWRKRRAAVRA